MSPPDILTVEQAAARLHLHPKTVLRYIREGRLSATRVGKGYRIARASVEALVGLAPERTDEVEVRVTCVVDIPSGSTAESERLATFLQAVALSRPPGSQPPMHLETAYDPRSHTTKVVVIASLSDVTRVLEMLQVQMRDRA